MVVVILNFSSYNCSKRVVENVLVRSFQLIKNFKYHIFFNSPHLCVVLIIYIFISIYHMMCKQTVCDAQYIINTYLPLTSLFFFTQIHLYFTLISIGLQFSNKVYDTCLHEQIISIQLGTQKSCSAHR